MRRKVLQDFANTFCQYYIDMGGCQDAAALAFYGSGTIVIDFLTGDCAFNGQTIPPLKSGAFLKRWLLERFAVHRIAASNIVVAQMTVQAVVSDVQFKVSYGYTFCSAFYEFQCESEIQTDEKSLLGFGTNGRGKSMGFSKERL